MRDYDMYDSVGKTVVITPKIIEKIKSLRASKADDSSYTPDGILLQWKYEDNKDICKSEDEFKELYMSMQFICMIGEITESFKQRYKVEHHHEALLRRLYIDLDDYDGLYITTAFKRPFGNSHVEGDVAEEMADTVKITGKKEYDPYIDEDEGEINPGLVSREYFKFLDILEVFMKEFEMEYRHFEGVPMPMRARTKQDLFDWNRYLQPEFGNHRYHSYLNNWKISTVEIRHEKIEKILNERL